MIIQKQYKYEEFKAMIEAIKVLPPLDNNKFIFMDVQSRLGDSVMVVFTYNPFRKEWTYEATFNDTDMYKKEHKQ
jgi:hypothetical protein